MSLRRCKNHNRPFPCKQCRIENRLKPAQQPTVIDRESRPTIKVPVEQVYCIRHAKPHPCARCIQDDLFQMKHIEQKKLAALFNETLHNSWAEAARIQNLPVVPPIGDWNTLDEPYDYGKYLRERNTGLRYAKFLLKQFPDSWKGFDDLQQIADIEIWMATKKYKDKMNGAIAYTIAKNQAGRFLKNQIDEQTIPVENLDGTPVLDEFGEPVRIPRHISLGDEGTDENGKLRETSPVENAIAMSGDEPRKAWVDDVRRKTWLLKKLVAGWFGAKRAVGEAILNNPESTVRDVPGVPKSTAARVRKTVLAEFRAAMGREWDKIPSPET